MIDRSVVSQAYVDMLAKDGHHNPDAFVHATREVLGDTEVRGKNILEIGSGRGLMAVLLGLVDAARVVSLEPELAGATGGVITEQQERIRALGLTNVEVVVDDFNTWNAGAAKFDVILSRASLNHLHHSEHNALRDRDTYREYLRVARKVHALTRPGGVFIATDASRYAFFTAVRRFGIRRPWRLRQTTVYWKHHQNPSVWRRIFKEAGFERVTVNYPVPHRLRFVAPLVNTRVADFFLTGSFILRAYK